MKEILKLLLMLPVIVLISAVIVPVAAAFDLADWTKKLYRRVTKGRNL